MHSFAGETPYRDDARYKKLYEKKRLEAEYAEKRLHHDRMLYEKLAHQNERFAKLLELVATKDAKVVMVPCQTYERNEELRRWCSKNAKAPFELETPQINGSPRSIVFGVFEDMEDAIKFKLFWA